MEYLKPIEVLQQTIKRYQITVICLCAVLGCAVIFTPLLARYGNPVLIKTDAGMNIADASPWKLSVTRLEQFTKSYLASRFEWKPDTFNANKENLKRLTTDQVYLKLKTSLLAFENLAQAQNAKSYFILEDFGFSNGQRKIEARVTKVLRINNIGMATPLRVLLSYQETSVSESNPFGLIINGLEEVELNELSKGGK